MRYAPDYQIEMPPEFAGVGIRSSYRGHAGLREWAADLDEAVTEKELTPVEVIDAGDRLVILAELHYRARSGVPMDTSWGQAVWFERGLMVRQLNFTDWDATLRAAGIPTTAEEGHPPGASSITRWEIEPLHRSHRGLDERLVLAAPWLLPLALSLCARARAGSPVRRALLGHVVRVGVDQVNRGDYGALSVGLSPEIEIHLLPDAPGGRPVDMEPSYRGREGYLKVPDMWKVGIEDVRFELRELLDPGGDRIAARVERVGRGARSGVEVRDTDFYVWQFERGMLRRQWVFASEEATCALLESGSG